MIRNTVERCYAEGLKYIDAAGLSTDTKPTTDLVTGSRFIEVDTGDEYAFDEVAGAWNKIRSGPQTSADVDDTEPTDET